MSGAGDYGVVNVRIRAAKAQFLTSAQYQRLMQCADLACLAAHLKETVYQSCLDDAETRTLTPRKFAWKLRQRIPEKFHLIHSHLPERVQPFYTFFFQYYDVLALKTVLRGIRHGDSWETVRFLMPTLEAETLFPYEKMVESSSIEKAIALTKGTPFHEMLSQGSATYKNEQSLFPLEVNLDLNYWRQVWEKLARLPENDQKTVAPIINAIIERNDLLWAARYRYFFNLTESEIINYTLGLGRKITDRQIRQAAAGRSAVEIANEAYPELALENKSTLGTGEQLSFLEAALTRRIKRLCELTFGKQPFSLGTSIAYLLLLEYEIQDLIILIEAKAAGFPKERFEPYLIHSIQSGK